MDRKAYIDWVAAQMKEMDAEARKIEARVQKAAARARIVHSDEIKAVRERLNSVGTKLEQVKKSSGDAWHELKPGVKKSLDDLKDAVHAAASKFKGE